MLDSQLNMVSKTHGRLARENLQKDNAKVDVAECASCRRHAVLGDSVGHGGGNESGEADVTDLADVVSVEEDVSVDEGLRLGMVEEEEASADFGRDSKTVLPGKRRGVGAHEETVLEAAVGHVFVDGAAVLGAGSQEEDHKYLLLKLRSPLSCVRSQDLDRYRRMVQVALVDRAIASLTDLSRPRKVFGSHFNLLDCVPSIPSILLFSSASFRAFISALILFWASSSASLWAASACSRAAFDLAFSFSARAILNADELTIVCAENALSFSGEAGSSRGIEMSMDLRPWCHMSE
ncbi:DNA-directed RNA polymerase subunit beta' [Striga asiatica]|uniref:DNA-directed RNA polymerase subunit beta n=1 Tax=Striga asiatica TaxID=4170 RepID=A0A5A7Q3P3_STRAF|nr:DNA-directed RNA polymerase subunit beta' [Striga asiatica]